MLKKVSELIWSGAPEGQRNERAFWLACQLRDDRQSEPQARMHMMAFAEHCTPPLHEREAEAALQQAFKSQPREQVAERTVDRYNGVVDFGQEAYVDGPPGGWDQAQDLIRYLRAVYRDGEHVRILPVLHGQGTSRPASELIDAVKREGVTAIGDYDRADGCWVLHNPTDGKGRKDANVTDLRHVLVECDDMPAEQQRAIIEELRLPCAAVVDAGNKSIHAIVRVDAGNDATLYAERVERLYSVLEARGYTVDRACRNPGRLSRLPGVWRGDRRQWLIGTNTGCASWGEWLDHLEGVKRKQHDIGALAVLDVVANDDSLIRPRFVTREGSWLIVASSGVGKSSLTVQHSMLFGLGRTVFGLQPARPLRSLIIQAENCENDLAEQVQGVIKGETLGSEDVAQIRRQIVLISEDSRCGPDFHNWLERTIAAHMPLDLVWLDPLLAYLGTGVNEQAEVTTWLRNGLNPIIHRHGVAVCVLHHTGKVRKQSQDDDYFMDYIGAGTSDLTNWARAVSFAERTGVNPTVVEWQHGKRGGRLPQEVRKVTIQHSQEGIIHWVSAGKMDDETFRECMRLLCEMPHRYDRNDRTTEDSMHAWGRAHLPVPRHHADDAVESARKAVSRGAEKTSFSRERDDAGVWVYRGRWHK